ncbi:helix-turn-helix transcriptional regulator [Rhizobium viscosum]|uniref:DNA-binding CsgD family transcriptional regulator n=1 Tax=Rhizobium viscosum TaxID=1673 RepID=A0ABR9IZS8_RHIVS|nr:helix-turn-helix transcriptional regulator [Rhizobium viscosum]MBE1508698.1 DNA-binding CsgD family transcriptional regulator [Rhizobium viscosum]
MTELSNPALSELIGTIYDCTLDASKWDQALEFIVGVFACEKAILSLNDLIEDRILIKKSVGWEPFWLYEREKHLPEIHGKLSAWLLRHPDLNNPFVASREIPPTDLEASAYLQKCLRPQGIVDVAHFFMISTRTHFSELVLFWAEQHGSVIERAIELGALLLPHLRRAVTISNVLGIRTIERTWMASTLDALRQGVVLVDGHGAILHANRSAEHMLQNGSPIEGVGGVLRAKRRTANTELSKALTLAARDESTIGDAGTAICLTEQNLPQIFAHVLPMGGGQLRSEMQPGAAAAVFIDASPDGQSSADALASAFRLTEAETRVLASLVAGRSLSETATELGIAHTTARTHLTHIFEKTGVSRQADLIRLAMQAAHSRPVSSR